MQRARFGLDLWQLEILLDFIATINLLYKKFVKFVNKIHLQALNSVERMSSGLMFLW
jgi:hypothetical protein